MSDILERRQPFSLEAEQSVLGAVLIDPAVLDELTGIVRAEDFYLEEHQSIYSAMQAMYARSKNIDVVTLIDELVQEGLYDEAGGREYIRLIAETVPTTSNAKDYANIVRNKRVLRALIKASEEITEAAYSEQEDVNKLVEMAESKIFAIAEDRENKNFVHIRDAMLSVYDNLDLLAKNPDEAVGMKTGFSGLDKVLVGLGKSDLVLVGARPGMGKTSFTLNLAVSAAKRSKKTVCIFSLEMSAEQLVSRIFSSEALIDSYHLRSGVMTDEDWKNLAHASSELSSLDILIDDTTGLTVTGMMAKLRRVKKELGMVVIDYLGLMTGEHHTDNRVQEISEISRNLKLLAKEFQVPVICCAQLSRGPESRTDKRPMLSDLRDSGAIEQDADIVMFLYRDEYYKDDPMAQNTAEVIIAKNRHGSTGTVKMGFLGAYTKFTTLENEQKE